MSNPCAKGLQLVNLGVRALALSHGATPKTIRGNDCSGIAPARDGWYKDLLQIENAAESLPEEIINYCVINFLKKTFSAMVIKDPELPDTLCAPEELQALLEGLCDRFGS